MSWMTSQAVPARNTHHVGWSATRNPRRSPGMESRSRFQDWWVASMASLAAFRTLRRLYGAGALTSYVVASEEGPHRKYYGITTAGRDELKRQRDDWRKFSTTITSLIEAQEAVA